jgi:hypothetical protein
MSLGQKSGDESIGRRYRSTAFADARVVFLQWLRFTGLYWCKFGGAGMSGQWQNRMGTIRVSAMIVVLIVVGILLFLRH